MGEVRCGRQPPACQCQSASANLSQPEPAPTSRLCGVAVVPAAQRAAAVLLVRARHAHCPALCLPVVNRLSFFSSRTDPCEHLLFVAQLVLVLVLVLALVAVAVAALAALAAVSVVLLCSRAHLSRLQDPSGIVYEVFAIGALRCAPPKPRINLLTWLPARVPCTS